MRRDHAGDPPMVSRHVTRVNGVITHATVRGHGPDVVVLPGLGCAAHMYVRLQAALAADFRVWVLDFPGHGRSADPPRRADSIERLIDHTTAWLLATDLSDVTLVGHSLGGEVAVGVVAGSRSAARRVVLLGATGLPDNPSVAHQLTRLTFDVPRERPAFLARALPAYLRAGSRRILRLALDQRVDRTVPRLARVHVPLLAVAGRWDPVVPPQSLDVLRVHVPHVVTCTVPGAHAFHDSHPLVTASVVRAFARGASIAHADPALRIKHAPLTAFADCAASSEA